MDDFRISRIRMRLYNIILKTAAAALLLASCTPEDKIEPDSPIKSGDWKEVPSYGGTISKDDITIEFPSGTFETYAKVAVSDVKKGSVAGSDEISPFYQITMDKQGTGKPFEVRINYSGKPEDVQAVVKMPTICVHQNKFVTDFFPVPYTVEDGYVSVFLPEFSKTSDFDPYFIIGLVKNTAPAPTKAGSYPTIWYYSKLSKDNEAAVMNILYKYVPEAFDRLRSVGIKCDFSFLSVSIKKFDAKNSTNYAYANPNIINKGLGYMCINVDRLEAMANLGFRQFDLQELQQTIVHELFHLVHNYYYDPRYGMTISWQGWWGNEWSMLGEAIGTWTEKLTGTKKIGGNGKEHLSDFLKHFCPFDGDATSYMHNGYGMGVFIDYLAQKTSDKKIVTLVEYQRDGAESLKDALDKFLSVNGLTFFSENSYMRFVTAAMNGDIQDIIDPVYSTFTEGNTVAINKAEKQRGYSDLYNFGISPAYLKLDWINMMPKLTDRDIVITQANSGVATYVYYVHPNTRKLVELGRATSSVDFSIPVSRLLQYNTKFPLVLLSTLEEPVYGPGKKEGIWAIEFPKADTNVPKISEITFSAKIAVKNDDGDTDSFLPDVTWATQYGSYIEVSKSGAGLDIKCDNTTNNYETSEVATLTFHVDSYSNGKMGPVSSLDFNYADTYAGSKLKGNLALKSMPLIENNIDPFNMNDALWKATNDQMKGKFSYYDRDGVVYYYSSQSGNYAKLYIEYK